MNTAKEILEEHLKTMGATMSESMKTFVLFAMEEYANDKVKLCNKHFVMKSVCIAPKGECDRKPEDVCKECYGCKFYQQTVL